MKAFARLPAEERALYWRSCSERKGVPEFIVEKDFWVCWTLKQLFCAETLRGNILFKGGTSLSKIFRAIQRFSEDIDLAVNFEMLGFTGPRHPSAAPSRNKRQKILDEMLIACCGYVAGEFLQLLAGRFANVLGPPCPGN